MVWDCQRCGYHHDKKGRLGQPLKVDLNAIMAYRMLRKILWRSVKITRWSIAKRLLMVVCSEYPARNDLPTLYWWHWHRLAGRRIEEGIYVKCEFSFSGGGNNTTYYASVDYFKMRYPLEWSWLRAVLYQTKYRHQRNFPVWVNLYVTKRWNVWIKSFWITALTPIH